MSSFFTIVVPAYNRASRLTYIYQCVLSQDFQDWELIIVDDGSTDGTKDVVMSFNDPRVVYIKIDNSERAKARNTGVLASKSKYITFLDSDDILYVQYLSTAYTYLSTHLFPEFFRAAYEVKSEVTGKVSRKAIVEGDLNQALIFGNFLSCLGVFVRSDIMRSNLFNEDRNLSGCEDYELWLRLSSRYRLHGLNKITAALIQHDDRSVLDEPQLKLETRVNLLFDYLMKDEIFIRVYAKKAPSFRANNYTYIALHLAMSGLRFGAVKYLFKGFLKYPGVIFRRRFYAIIKKLLLG